jgi:hypothetical protein
LPEHFRNWDVRGQYALSYDERLTVTLSSGGRVRTQQATDKDVVNLGGPILDLGDFCARHLCPGEILGAQTAVDQTDPDEDLLRHAISVGGHAGFVDHSKQDEFTVSVAGSNCDPLAAFTGRFTHRGESVTQEPSWQDADGGVCVPLDGGTCALSTIPGGVSWPGDAPVDGLAHGRIGAYFPASCAGLDGTLSLSIGFTGSRLGDASPFDLAAPTAD